MIEPRRAGGENAVDLFAQWLASSVFAGMAGAVIAAEAPGTDTLTLSGVGGYRSVGRRS